jgi:hypothetical protein
MGISWIKISGKTAQEWAKISQQKDARIASISASLNMDESILQTLASAPTPTPIIQYQTTYVADPNTERQLQQAKQELEQPVQYNSYGGTMLYGSNGSTCNTYGTNTLYCNK